MTVLCDFVISLHIEDLRYIMLQQHRGQHFPRVLVQRFIVTTQGKVLVIYALSPQND